MVIFVRPDFWVISTLTYYRLPVKCELRFQSQFSALLSATEWRGGEKGGPVRDLNPGPLAP